MPTNASRFGRGLAAVAVCAVAWAGPIDSARAMTGYVVEPGDGFYAIAAATGADLAAILDVNDLRLDSVIHPGQRLIIPDVTAVPAQSSQASQESGASSGTSGTVTVRAGDGLYAVARRAGVSLERLLSANGLTITSIIHPGQRLDVPGAAPATSAPATPVPAESSQESGASSGTSGTVTVRAGDGLYAVARRAGVSLERLLSANGLTITSIIHPGQRLDVPGAAPATSAPASTSQASGTQGPSAQLTLPPDVADRSLVEVFRRRASEAGIPADLLMAVCYRESRWNAGAVSSAGASGICQLMPGTAAWVARDIIGQPGLDRMDADDNIRMGAHLLGWLLRRADGDVGRALAMYGQGVAGVERDGVSEFSRKYIGEIADLRRRFG